MITVRIYKVDDWSLPGYGRWFWEIWRDERMLRKGGAKLSEERTRRDLASFARASNLPGAEAYAVDVAAYPTYHDGTPRKAWADLGAPERYSWEKHDGKEKEAIRRHS